VLDLAVSPPSSLIDQLARGMSENSACVFGAFAWFNHFFDNGLSQGCQGASDIVFFACHSSLSCCFLKISPTQSKNKCADHVEMYMFMLARVQLIRVSYACEEHYRQLV